jgi:Mn2+/Fe2+ NRAMP family transporter
MIWGPGTVVMLADTDAGNVGHGGPEWRTVGLSPFAAGTAANPMLYMVQELTVRLGIYTGRGRGELIRTRFGLGWACLASAKSAAH